MALPLMRARFGGDIVSEFLPPVRTSHKVAILAAGCPGYPGSKDELMHFLARRGYWSFLPRYRGTWESGGVFLEQSPDTDLITIMDEISEGFVELWSGTEYRIENPEIYLIGGSFGGAATLLASRDPRVKKAATISGVADWREQAQTLEPLPLMSTYVPQAFGMAYRSNDDGWKKLAEGNFYNPAAVKDTILGSKLLMIHAKDDLIVHHTPGQTLAKDIGARFVLLKEGGHMGVGSANKPYIWKHIRKFFHVR